MDRTRPVLRWVLLAGTALALLWGVAILGLVLAYRTIEPVSTPMLARKLFGEPVRRLAVPLSAVAPVLVTSVLASEDGGFCRHHGVDFGALREVLRRPGGPARGASTIAMQVARNLFLSQSRSVIRKALEIPIALAIDALWPKRRIVEVYLNIAEWGEGVFGVEAGARQAFGHGAGALTPREAALLATALPNPILRDPAHPGREQARLADRLMRRAENFSTYFTCVAPPGGGPSGG